MPISATAIIETSLWEAAICTVQQTDFRNFAHGRHSWLHHRPHHTVVLALTGHDTAELWDQYQRLLPPEIRQITMDFGNCGRFQNAVGIMRGLVWIEAMGRAVGIDPGKRSEEHTSELQSLMRNSYAVFCLKKKKYKKIRQYNNIKQQRKVLNIITINKNSQ